MYTFHLPYNYLEIFFGHFSKYISACTLLNFSSHSFPQSLFTSGYAHAFNKFGQLNQFPHHDITTSCRVLPSSIVLSF